MPKHWLLLSLFVIVFWRERLPVQPPPPLPPAAAPAVTDPTLPPSVPPVAVGVAPGDRSSADRHWTDPYARQSAGYCPWVSGSGWSGSLVWPLDGGELPPEQHARPGHMAIDINAPMGTAVYAAATGTVVWAGSSLLGGGNKVILSHGNGWLTRYVHLDEVAVTCGQTVAQGDLIGRSGRSGTSWPHLHFAVWRGGQALDPCQWLDC